MNKIYFNLIVNGSFKNKKYKKRLKKIFRTISMEKNIYLYDYLKNNN